MTDTHEEYQRHMGLADLETMAMWQRQAQRAVELPRKVWATAADSFRTAGIHAQCALWTDDPRKADAEVVWVGRIVLDSDWDAFGDSRLLNAKDKYYG